MTLWILRESFLAYERFYGAFSSKEAALKKAPTGTWKPIERQLPEYMFDDKDPFNSKEGALSTQVGTSLWIIEPIEMVDD